MRNTKKNQGGFVVTAIVVLGVVILVVVFVARSFGCSGGGVCTTRACTTANPCIADWNGDGTVSGDEECTSGVVCTNGGTKCDDKYWFQNALGFNDCFCDTVLVAPNQCGPGCLKP